MEVIVHASPTLEGTALRALRGDVVATVLEDGAVLLDLESKYFYALNATGWSIVQHFEAGSFLAAVDDYARASGAPDDGSVRTFVAALESFGLLEPTIAAGEGDPPAAPPVWTPPTIERQPEPLQRVLVSAFDPSVPLAE